MIVSDRVAAKVAARFADEIMEAVECELGVQLDIDPAADIAQAIEADIAEAIQDAFDSAG